MLLSVMFRHACPSNFGLASFSPPRLDLFSLAGEKIVFFSSPRARITVRNLFDTVVWNCPLILPV
jgi:hypothetical protein